MWFTKSDEYTFNLDAVRISSKYPGKQHFKGKHKGQLSGNSKGKNPEDVWEMMIERLADDWEHEIWNFPNVISKKSITLVSTLSNWLNVVF